MSARNDMAEQMATYFDRLWPLHRSITGEGVRATHDILSELAPLKRIEVPSGTEVFDWIVPKEWVVRDAYVTAPDGRRILNVKDNNLHLLNYAAPFRGSLTREELEAHLYSLPEQPDAIPYKTSYYAERWGFCIADRQRKALPEGVYEVMVDTDFIDGSMTLSEAVLPGETDEEILFSTYTCHPSMANNELSGPLVAAFLYRHLSGLAHRRYTYRFAFLAETIGAIAYLNLRGERLLQRLAAGFVLTCIGTSTPFTAKRSRRGDTLADRAIEAVARQEGEAGLSIIDFFPTGSDERQYCSPGFNLPVAMIARAAYEAYPEYHTSLDNRDFISFEALAESVELCARLCTTLERNGRFENTVSKGEPQLSRHGLMSTLGAASGVGAEQSALFWLLNLSDGQHDLIDISERSGHGVELLAGLADKCLEAGLLKALSGPGEPGR